MIIELTPETFFEHVKKEGPLHVVMHYGETCGPCKMTMPHYEKVEAHFVEFKVFNVKFYKFHQWAASNKEFIQENNLKTDGVPTFRYYYMGDVITHSTRSFNDADELKRNIMDAVKAIETTMGQEFNLYEG